MGVIQLHPATGHEPIDPRDLAATADRLINGYTQIRDHLQAAANGNTSSLQDARRLIVSTDALAHGLRVMLGIKTSDEPPPPSPPRAS